MKIAVIGNCQALGFAKSLEAQAGPFEQLKMVHVRYFEAGISLAADYVFAQPDIDAAIYGERVIRWPYLSTLALQPDCHYRTLADGSVFNGPMGPLHSILAGAAFLSGLSVERTVSLFNSYIFDKLGYFDTIDAHRLAMADSCAKLGYDVSPFINDVARGCYMHTINHPRIDFIYEIARQSALKAGMAVREADMPIDDLASSVRWPIYPELAKRMARAEASYNFQALDRTVLSLSQFVEASFEAYEITPVALQSNSIERAHDILAREVRI